jgi:hypothetical protein
VVLPDKLPRVAVIVTVVSVAVPDVVTWPLEPTALEIDAKPLGNKLQVTVFVRSCVVPSEKIPVAKNGIPFPPKTDVLEGNTLIDSSTDVVTVTVAELEVNPDKLALTVADPTARALASPVVPAALLTDRTCELEEVQVADAVTSCVVPSEKVPVAVNCWALPTAMLELAGVTDRETRVAG